MGVEVVHVVERILWRPPPRVRFGVERLKFGVRCLVIRVEGLGQKQIFERDPTYARWQIIQILLLLSLSTSNLSKGDQLLTTHRSPSTGNRDPL